MGTAFLFSLTMILPANTGPLSLHRSPAITDTGNPVFTPFIEILDKRDQFLSGLGKRILDLQPCLMIYLFADQMVLLQLSERLGQHFSGDPLNGPA